MGAPLIAALIIGAASIGSAAYGGASQAQAAKKKKKERERQRLLEAYEEAANLAGTSASSQQGAMDALIQKNRELLGS